MKLQRSQTGDLQMLIHRKAAAKPSQIADIDKDAGSLGRHQKLLCQFLTKQVFVTNIRG